MTDDDRSCPFRGLVVGAGLAVLFWLAVVVIAAWWLL